MKRGREEGEGRGGMKGGEGQVSEGLAAAARGVLLLHGGEEGR